MDDVKHRLQTQLYHVCRYISHTSLTSSHLTFVRWGGQWVVLVVWHYVCSVACEQSQWYIWISHDSSIQNTVGVFVPDTMCMHVCGYCVNIVLLCVMTPIISDSMLKDQRRMRDK